MDKTTLAPVRRIFLDVGANKGQTLAAVLDPSLRFDWIVCFEPSSACWESLTKMADERTSIEPYGLWNVNVEATLHGGGAAGSSLWPREGKIGVEQCQFRRASDFFKQHITPFDSVFLKINVEGAECDILDDLLDSGEFEKVTYLMVDFDVRKIPSQKHREAELKKRLEPFPFPRVALTKQVMHGDTHQARIKSWLHMVGV